MRTLLMLGLALVIGCGPSSPGKDEPDPPAVIPDADGDGISDEQEGAAARVDTDGDGTADYLDRDSDGDSLPDADEAGDNDLKTAPHDSDDDQLANFRDLDSDGNGRDDELEGLGDLDGDSIADFADPDNDRDFIYDLDEIGPNPSVAVDTDGDGTPDMHDLDSDGDGVGDVYETAADFDGDGHGNFRDLDSDGDCRLDSVESGGAPAPRDSDNDKRYDFIDRDSDNDGVADRIEDGNCDGRHATPETDAVRPDSDGDGVSDLVEREAGTDPNSGSDHPRARGDFVFVMPHQLPAMPASDDLDFKPALSNVDLYVLIDRSASMAAETESIKNELGGVVRSLQCAPVGTGTPGNCIPDLHAGLGGIGYRTNQPFRHYLSIQQSPNFAGTDVPNVGGQNTDEPLVFGVWTAISNATSGQANSNYGCGLALVQPNTTCPTGQHYGQACFRPGSLPVIVLATDEPALETGADTTPCPGWNEVVRASMTDPMRKAKLVGVYGSSPLGMTISNLMTMARETGAVDASAGTPVPLVFDGADARAADAIGDGIRALVRGIPLDMKAIAVDQPGDSVDARATFVDYLETLQLGTAKCANGLTDADSDADGRDDQFLGVRAGVGLCWKLAIKPNTTVPEIDAPQLFRARIDVLGDCVTVVDSRDVFFLVPPRLIDEPID